MANLPFNNGTIKKFQPKIRLKFVPAIRRWPICGESSMWRIFYGESSKWRIFWQYIQPLHQLNMTKAFSKMNIYTLGGSVRTSRDFETVSRGLVRTSRDFEMGSGTGPPDNVQKNAFFTRNSRNSKKSLLQKRTSLHFRSCEKAKNTGKA